jgi:protein-tyrosine-phosphatase
MNILFVCTGNISRSFLAKALLLDEISKNSTKDIKISSAGTGAYPGTPADPEMVKFLTEKKIPVPAHASKLITSEDIKRADMILVMEKPHYNYIVKRWPESAAKVEMLGRYISPDHPDDEIIDPYGRSPYHYRLVQSQILLAVSNLVRAVVPRNQS